MSATGLRAPATAPVARASDANLLRRADAAGQRLFRELVASRIAWATVSEVSRLIAVDVAAFSLRATGCAHPQPCRLHHCRDRLEMAAVLGNRGPRLPGLSLGPGAGAGGRALRDGRPVHVPDYADGPFAPELREVVAGEEGVRALVALPVSFGGEVHGVLHAGLRRDGAFGPGPTEALVRLCAYAGAAMAAARDRARVEEIAAGRERRRLARALHDELGQHLFGIGLSARRARESAASGRADLLACLHGLEREVAAASGALRRTLRSLDTPAPGGSLAVKLREGAAAFAARTSVPAHLLVIGAAAELDPVREELLVRVAHEGMRNVERHADATEVILTLCFEPGRVELAVHDDGVRGVSAGGGTGMGLATLHEEIARVGGDLRLGAGEDAGATLRARLLLP